MFRPKGNVVGDRIVSFTIVRHLPAIGVARAAPVYLTSLSAVTVVDGGARIVGHGAERYFLPSGR